MPHAKSRPAADLWCLTVDMLLAKGASFAEALDGANMILQAYKRQRSGDQADEADPAERERQASTRERERQLLAALRVRMG